MPKIMYMDENYSGSSYGNLEEYSEDILYSPSTPPAVVNRWDTPLDTGITQTMIDQYQFLEINAGGDTSNSSPTVINTSSLSYTEYTMITLIAEENANTHAVYLRMYDNKLWVYASTGVNIRVWYIKGIKVGNSNIIPNPVETSTKNLVKLQVGEEIYKITDPGLVPKGVYAEKVLWSSPNGTSSVANVTLSDSISNYDVIYVVAASNGYPDYRSSQMIPVSSIDKTGSNKFGIFDTATGSNPFYYSVLTYVDETHLILGEWGSSYHILYFKIVGINFGTQSPVVYSTEEREVGVWTDGKPLYQKTINFGALPNNTAKSVAHGISNIDKIVDISGEATNPSNNVTLALPYGYPTISGKIITSIYADRTNLTFITADDLSGYTYTYLTIQYTKTTDVAGSGRYAELGEPAVHYDTSERVIGTYFGKPLYRKGFVFSSLTFSSQTVSVTNDLSNIDEVTNCGGSFYEPRDNRNMPLPYTRKIYNEHINIQPVVLNSDHTVSMQLVTNDNWYQTIQNVKIWLEYTKTTD